MDVNGKSNKRNQKFLRATSELPNTTFENRTVETLETMKYNKENKLPSHHPKTLIHKRRTARAEGSQ